MESYHNDIEFKKACVAAAQRAVDLDMLRKGTYGDMNGGFKGCSVGCDAFDITGGAISINIHQITADYFGFPVWLERLRDSLYEALEDETGWHVRIKQSIPEGVTEERFNVVRSKFVLFLLEEKIVRVNALSIDKNLKKQVIKALNQGVDLHVNVVNGGKWDRRAAEVNSAIEAIEASAAIDVSEGCEAGEVVAQRHADKLLELLETA